MIYLGADHGGFEFKEQIKVWLEEKGLKIQDMGAYSFDPADDYPDFVIPLAKRVAEEPESLGLILGRSGNGEAMAANKVDGIRAVVCTNPRMAKMAREHNNANIISLGADYMDLETAQEIIQTFLDTPFTEEERHIRRINKILELEKRN